MSSQQITYEVRSEVACNGSTTDLGQVQRRETEMLRGWAPEHKEAVQAFIEKRAPKFR